MQDTLGFQNVPCRSLCHWSSPWHLGTSIKVCDRDTKTCQLTWHVGFVLCRVGCVISAVYFGWIIINTGTKNAAKELKKITQGLYIILRLIFMNWEWASRFNSAGQWKIVVLLPVNSGSLYWIFPITIMYINYVYSNVKHITIFAKFLK